jgi:predicted transcriptional regulator
MIAEEILSADLFPLKRSDNVETAMLFMHDWQVSHLPVVESNAVVGYVSTSDLSNLSRATKIDKHTKADVLFTAPANAHVLDLLRVFSQTALSTVAIIDAEQHFRGIVSYRELNNALYKQSALSQPGGLITLEMAAIDYSLAELTRIAEYNDVKIIHVHIHPLADAINRIQVSLKFNRTDLKNVVSAFERHGKNILYIHGAVVEGEALANRYDWLIKYLST